MNLSAATQQGWPGLVGTAVSTEGHCMEIEIGIERILVREISIVYVLFLKADLMAGSYRGSLALIALDIYRYGKLF